jgi:hypothetical protein
MTTKTKAKAETVRARVVSLATSTYSGSLPTACDAIVGEWFDIDKDKVYELVITTAKPASMRNVYQWRRRGDESCAICQCRLDAKHKNGRWGEDNQAIPYTVCAGFPGGVLPKAGYAWLEEVEAAA